MTKETLPEKSKLKSILELAIANLFEHQANIIEFTSETGQTEWNLADHQSPQREGRR